MRRKCLFSVTLILSMMLYLCNASYAATTKTIVIPEIQKQYSAVLIQLGIMAAPVKSTPKLSDKIKSSDFNTLLNNAMSIDPDPAVAKSSGKVEITYVTYIDAQKLILKALGYESSVTGYSTEQLIARSAELGLSTGLELQPDKQLTRGEATVLIYNSMTIDFAVIN